MADIELKRAFTKVQSSAIDGRASYSRFREDQLAALFNLLSSNEDAIIKALKTDTGRPTYELALELSTVLKHVQACFKETEFKKFASGTAEKLAKGEILKPLGAVLIVGGVAAPLDSWLSPLASNIVAGNTAVIILPELPTLSALLHPILSAGLNPFAYQLLLPSSSLTSSITSLSPSLTIYTGTNPTLRASLSSVKSILYPTATGGNPLIISSSAPSSTIASLARLVARGAFYNAGRSLNSINYVLVHEELVQTFTEALVSATKEMFGVDAGLSDDFAKVAASEAGRLRGAIGEAVRSGEGKVVIGGVDKDGVVVPTIITNVTRTSALIQQRLEGPVLPIVSISSLEDALSIALSKSGSVAYVFGNSADCHYLAHELNVSTVYNNDIPLEALIGLGTTLPSSLLTKSTTYLSPLKTPLSSIFPPFTSNLRTIFGVAKALKVKRAPHATPILRSFFPQGLFLMVGGILSVILSGTGYGVFSLFKYYTRSL
ncbi:aldehyde dehydrogenase [Pseudohyphozyma bogoriensis]|nr:aldehyde dehydrogenase [Pseudohyphozyma bogoriensis]